MHFANMQKELDVSMKLTSRAMPQNVDLPEPPSALPSAAATTLIFISSLVRYLMISRLPPVRKSAFEFPRGRIPFALVVLTFPISLKEFWNMLFARLLSRYHQNLLLNPKWGQMKTWEVLGNKTTMLFTDVGQIWERNRTTTKKHLANKNRHWKTFFAYSYLIPGCIIASFHHCRSIWGKL